MVIFVMNVRIDLMNKCEKFLLIFDYFLVLFEQDFNWNILFSSLRLPVLFFTVFYFNSRFWGRKIEEFYICHWPSNIWSINVGQIFCIDQQNKTVKIFIFFPILNLSNLIILFVWLNNILIDFFDSKSNASSHNNNNNENQQATKIFHIQSTITVNNGACFSNIDLCLHFSFSDKNPSIDSVARERYGKSFSNQSIKSIFLFVWFIIIWIQRKWKSGCSIHSRSSSSFNVVIIIIDRFVVINKQNVFFFLFYF